jgi:hypothetical protein
VDGAYGGYRRIFATFERNSWRCYRNVIFSKLNVKRIDKPDLVRELDIDRPEIGTAVPNSNVLTLPYRQNRRNGVTGGPGSYR